jgi:NitT/TauT family transport system ATP-binding protein
MPVARTSAHAGAEVRFVDVRADHTTGATTQTVLRNLDLTLQPGEFVCLLGKTGCGKSTMLKLVLGELEAAEGAVLVEGKPVKGLGRHCGYVPQKYSLFPDRRVLDNITFGPRTAENGFWAGFLPSGRQRAQRMNDVALSLLARMGMCAADGRKFPHELSGGMQQRVAIAQALATDPRLLLMDEAFSALDAITRSSMQELMREVCTERATTVLFVTHSVGEALLLASRIIVLSREETAETAAIALDMPSPWSIDTPVAERRTSREFNEALTLLETATRGDVRKGPKAVAVLR